MKRQPNPITESLRVLTRKYRPKMMEFAEANSTDAGISDEQYQQHFETLVEDDEQYKKLSASLGSHLFVQHFKRVSKDHPQKKQMLLFTSADELRAHYRNTLVEVGGGNGACENEDETNDGREGHGKTVAAINVKVQHVRDRIVRSQKNRDSVNEAHEQTVEIANEQIALMMRGLDYVESLVSIWEKLPHKRPDDGAGQQS